MPMYEYKCPDHGVFEQLGSLDSFDQPSMCPQCQLLSQRIVAIPPAILEEIKAKRLAQELNEKAQHEPLAMTTSEYEEREIERKARTKHAHGSSCGCDSKSKSKNMLMYTADGNKMFPTMRPWMISH